MSRIATLDYEHADVAPNRYEWEMESERARWLRRRFLWFSGTLVVLGVVTLPISCGQVTDNARFTSAAGWINIGSSVMQIAAAGWAWWYARRGACSERRLFAIAFWLVVGLGTLGMLAAHVSVDLHLRDELAQLRNTVAERNATRGPIQIEVSTAQGETVSSGGVVRGPSPRVVRSIQQGASLFTLTWSIFATHMLACLFLPWTVREAWRPAKLLLAFAGLLVVADLFWGRGSIWYLAGAVVLLPVMVLPGLGWAWWRYSRFRKQYRFTFESNQLRQLKQELTGARRIHESSLPPIHSAGPLRLTYIYEPMSQIGGDLLFVHPRPPGTPSGYVEPRDGMPPPRNTMILLDVTGHGIAAALTVNRLVGELERIFAETSDVGAGELMAALNRYVYLTLATHGVFVTGVAISSDVSGAENRAAYYRDPHKIAYASAGHPPAFVRRADGRMETLDRGATMLGVLPPEAYDSEETGFHLHPGDAIVAYTDGAIEARNVDDEMIGIDGVRDLIGAIARETADPVHWPEQLIRRVAAWRNAPPADDTLIAVIYRPPMPESAIDATDGDRTSRPETIAAMV